jgi:Lon protease-like protein
MTTYLPLFPLQLVVFPGEKLNLHVFEERYKELISTCFNGTLAFGIVSYFNETVQDYGTEVEITSIEKIYPDGRMDVRIKGLRTFKMEEFFEKSNQGAYPAGNVSFNHGYVQYPLHEVAEDNISKKLKEILIQLGKILDVSKNLIPSKPQNMSFSIAHYLGMPLEKEYELLLTTHETERQQKLISYLEQALPDIKKRERMKSLIALNGHFKEITPPNF